MKKLLVVWVPWVTGTLGKANSYFDPPQTGSVTVKPGNSKLGDHIEVVVDWRS